MQQQPQPKREECHGKKESKRKEMERKGTTKQENEEHLLTWTSVCVANRRVGGIVCTWTIRPTNTSRRHHRVRAAPSARTTRLRASVEQTPQTHAIAHRTLLRVAVLQLCGARDSRTCSTAVGAHGGNQVGSRLRARPAVGGADVEGSPGGHTID